VEETLERRKSADKRHIQSQKRRLKNRAVKSRIRTTLKKTTAENLNKAYSLIDKAVKTRAVHKKTAGRMKSKLARQLTPKPKPKKKKKAE